MKLIGIAGGSGSGKSTLCYSLVDNNPNIFSIIHLDDYCKSKNDSTIPIYDGIKNRDHPTATNWDKLISDVEKLQNGESVTVLSWNHKDYRTHKEKINYVVKPNSIVLLEGHLSLWNKDLLKKYDRTYFLDLDHKMRMKRRDKFKDPVYEEKILIPMHNEHIEPSKQDVDVIIDVSELNTEEVDKAVKDDLNNTFDLNLV